MASLQFMSQEQMGKDQPLVILLQYIDKPDIKLAFLFHPALKKLTK